MAAVSGSMEQGGQAAEEIPRFRIMPGWDPVPIMMAPESPAPCRQMYCLARNDPYCVPAGNKEHGDISLCQCPQGVDISEHAGVAVWFREISAVFFIRYGGAVPQVIVSSDQIALFAEKVGKLFISPDKFAHAVTDLQYSPDVFPAGSFDRVNPGFLIG